MDERTNKCTKQSVYTHIDIRNEMNSPKEIPRVAQSGVLPDSQTESKTILE